MKAFKKKGALCSNCNLSGKYLKHGLHNLAENVNLLSNFWHSSVGFTKMSFWTSPTLPQLIELLTPLLATVGTLVEHVAKSVQSNGLRFDEAFRVDWREIALNIHASK